MRYKIAIVCEKESLCDQLADLARRIEAELIRFQPQKMRSAVLMQSMPNLVILTSTCPQWPVLASQIREMGALREVPIMLLSYTMDEVLKEKAILSGVNDFIDPRAIDEQTVTRIRLLIENNSRFVGSYTQRFIRSVVNYSQAEALAASMSAVVRMAAKELQLDALESVDLLRGAQLLSCAVKEADPKRILRFYRSMDFAHQLGDLLEGVLSPRSLTEQILALVYEMQCVRYRGEPVAAYQPSWTVEHALLDRVRSLFMTPRIPVSGVMDIDLVFERLSELICQSASTLSLKSADQLLEAVRRLLHHALVDHGGAMVQIPPRLEGWVEIVYADETLRVGCARSVEKLERLDQIVIVPLTDKSGFRLQILPGHYQMAAPPKPVAASSDRAPLSAAAYLSAAPVAWDEMETLKDYEEDLFEHVLTSEYTRNPAREVAVMIALLRSYGSAILYLVEFSTIANALLMLGGAMEELGIEQVAPKSLNRLPVLIDGLVRDLRGWREAVFIRQDAADVHFQDSAITAACDQILYMLQGREDEEDMELF
jgi:DNA-binding response OmpR family regulator